MPYNSNIATVFYYAGFVESWGRGIEKIRNACKADGVPMLEYTVHSSDIMVKFTAPEDRIVRVTKEVTDKEKKVLELLYEDPGFTMPALAEKMNVSRKSIASYLKTLKEKGVVVRVGGRKEGYWKINNK